MLEEATELALIQAAATWEGRAEACLAENTVEELQVAVMLCKGAKALTKDAKEKLADTVKAGKAAHDTALKALRDIIGPTEAAERIIKAKVVKFFEAEYAEQAKEYTLRLAVAEDAAKKARKAEVGSLRLRGEAAKANALESSELLIPAVPRPVPTKIPGVSVTERWSAELDDDNGGIIALVKYVAKNPAFRHLVALAGPEANKLATAQKENFQFPGLRATAKPSVTVRI